MDGFRAGHPSRSCTVDGRVKPGHDKLFGCWQLKPTLGPRQSQPLRRSRRLIFQQITEAALQETQMSAAEDKRFRIAWKALHDNEAAWSSAGRHLLVRDSGHRIQTDRPQVVIDAVGSVVEAVRSRRR
jgi:hypothetical protein